MPFHSVRVLLLVIDRYWSFRTDTDYLYVYVPDNRYAELIFIYCYKVSEVSPFFSFSHLNNNKQLLKINIFMYIFIFKLQQYKHFIYKKHHQQHWY